MYKKYFIFISIYFCISFLFSCEKPFDETSYKRIVPQEGNSIILEKSSQNSDATNYSAAENNSNNNFSTFLPENYVLLDYTSTTLDKDDLEEEIILYTTHTSNIVYVLIASIDSKLQEFTFVWQSETLLHDKKPASLSVKDITSNGQKEIIVQGSIRDDVQESKDKTHVLEVFSLAGRTSALTRYKRIFSATSSEDINIEENPNSNDFFIAVYDIDTNKNIIKTLYKWNTLNKEYKYFQRQVFTQDDISAEKINNLYYGNNAEWQEHLKGIWKKKDTDSKDLFIAFSNQIPEVTVYKSNSIITFHWLSMIRTINSEGIGAQIRINNLSLPNIKKWISLQVINDESVSIIFGEDRDDIELNGIYTRLSENEIINNVFAPLSDNSNLLNLDITAKYINELNKDFTDFQSNTHYSFAYPVVKIINENAESQIYYFSVFRIASNVIMQIKDYTKNSQESRFYVIQLNEENTLDEDSKITLQPVYLSAHNIYNISNSPNIELVKDK